MESDFFKRLQIIRWQRATSDGKSTICWSNPCYVYCPPARSSLTRRTAPEQAVCHVGNSEERFTGTQHGDSVVTPTRWSSSVLASPVSSGWSLISKSHHRLTWRTPGGCGPFYYLYPPVHYMKRCPGSDECMPAVQAPVGFTALMIQTTDL